MSAARALDLSALPLAANDNGAHHHGKVIYNDCDAAGASVHVKELPRSGMPTAKVTDYISGPNGIQNKGVGARLVDNAPVYVHADHLGSPRRLSEQDGTHAGSAIYSPFGMEVNINLPDDQAEFTGHLKDSATGLNRCIFRKRKLHDMQARYYDPVMGRFLSIDPVTFGMTGDPRYFNRYAYTFNDPINLIDSDGRNPAIDRRADAAFEIARAAAAQVPGAINDFQGNLNDMVKSNTIGNDKFFHCKANCQATQRGDIG